MKPIEDFHKGSEDRSGAAPPRRAARKQKDSLAGVSSSKEDISFAEKLIKIGITRKVLNTRNVSRAKLARHVAALREVDGHERERVASVLAWYLTNIDRAFVPKAYSGETLRAKFLSICEAFDRENPDYGLVISQRAQDLGERVWNYGWPRPELKKSFPAILQHSLNNISYIRSALKALPPGTAAQSRAVALLDDVLGHESQHAAAWWVRVHEKLARWEKWDGDARRHAPSLDNADYVTMLINTVHRFAGESAADAAAGLLKGIQR